LLAEPRLPEPPAKADQAKVLIIEDDPAVARMLRFCFRQAGFDVTEVSTGDEALRILQQEEPPHAAVLDLQLPDRQGGAVLEWLRCSGERTTSSPVWVVMSALDRETAAERYGALGSHFLNKPFDPWDLVAILRKLLAAKS